MPQESLYSSVTVDFKGGEKRAAGGGRGDGSWAGGERRQKESRTGDVPRVLWLRFKFLSESDQVILSKATRSQYRTASVDRACDGPLRTE